MTYKLGITFAISEKLKQMLRNELLEKDYHIRNKSFWISKAIEDLIFCKSFLSIIENSNRTENLNQRETIMIDHDLKLKLDKANFKLRTELPMVEGGKSMIIRTAILFRIKNNTY